MNGRRIQANWQPTSTLEASQDRYNRTTGVPARHSRRRPRSKLVLPYTPAQATKNTCARSSKLCGRSSPGVGDGQVSAKTADTGARDTSTKLATAIARY